MTDTLTIAVYRTQAEGSLQVQIVQTDENGAGSGYRLAGPEHYNLGTTELLSRDLDEQDAAEIRACLDAVFPQGPSDELAALRKRVAELEEDARTLRALEAAGVDSWEGYSLAFEGLDD